MQINNKNLSFISKDTYEKSKKTNIYIKCINKILSITLLEKIYKHSIKLIVVNLKIFNK